MKLLDITGQTFGRLTAVAPTSRRSKANNCIWLFRCSCGGTHEADGLQVRNGHVGGCPKCRSERRRKKHGLTESAEFKIWTGIQTRCYNGRCAAYRLYGGRGIKMCKAWKDSFKTFLSDMGERPSPQHSIDRIDNDGPYSPANCRWASRHEQALNRRTNIFVTIDGRTQTLIEWGRQYGIAVQTIWRRWKAGCSGVRLVAPVRVPK